MPGGQPAASAWALGTTRVIVWVSHHLPQTVSPDPFLEVALHLPLKSHMGLGPRTRLFSRMGEGSFL